MRAVSAGTVLIFFILREEMMRGLPLKMNCRGDMGRQL